MPDLLRLRYGAACHACLSPLPSGSLAHWDRTAKRATCAACADTAGAPGTPPADPAARRVATSLVAQVISQGPPGNEGTPQLSPAPAEAGEPAAATPAVVLDAGVAGGSARRIADRQQTKRDRAKRAADDATREAHPTIGGLLVRARDLLAEPAPPTSWMKGAAGEEAVGRTFQHLAEEGFVVMHDRRRPGQKSNIDHIVIGPRGVYVIDAKHYGGLLEIRSTGSLFRPGPNRVFVRGRPQDKRLASMDWQVRWVRDAVGGDVEAAGGVIKPVLCFVGVELGLGQRAAIAGANDVVITWPRRFVKDVSREGPMSEQQVQGIARQLASALPAAVPSRAR